MLSDVYFWSFKRQRNNMFVTNYKMISCRKKWGKFGAMMGQIKHAILKIEGLFCSGDY